MTQQQRQKAEAKGTVVAERWKGIKEEDEWSEQTLLRLAGPLAAHRSWLEERERKTLGGGESDRGEKLPARLDKTVHEIPAEKVSFLSFSFTHFPKQKGVTSSFCIVCVCV